MEIRHTYNKMLQIKLSKTRPHELQPQDRGGIADLKASIQHVGSVLVPPTLMENDDGTYTILSGHRRIQAARSAGQKVLTCDVWPPMTLLKQVKVLTASNEQRELNAMQKAGMLADVIREQGMSFGVACQAMNISKLVGKALLRLEDAPVEVRVAIRRGELSFGTFRRELASLDNEHMIEALSSGTTRRAIKRKKARMVRDEAPERLIDDSSTILEELTTARRSVTRAASWLVGSESVARAEVLEALRGLLESVQEARGAT